VSTRGSSGWLDGLDLSTEGGQADARKYVEEQAKAFNPDVTDTELARAINFDNPAFFVKLDLEALGWRPSKYIPARAKPTA
jgi:hypothetical protein